MVRRQGPDRDHASAPAARLRANAVSCAADVRRGPHLDPRAISPAISRRLASRDSVDVDIDRLGQEPMRACRCDRTSRQPGDGCRQCRLRPGRLRRRARLWRQFIARDIGDSSEIRSPWRGNSGRVPEATLARIAPARLHRDHAPIGGGIPRCRQNGAAPRRKAFHDLLGPPVNHGAFFRPRAHPDTEWRAGQKNTRVFMFGEFLATRFKELNTYSGRLTRCIATVFVGFATARHGFGRRMIIPAHALWFEFES